MKNEQTLVRNSADGVSIEARIRDQTNCKQMKIANAHHSLYEMHFTAEAAERALHAALAAA